MSEGTCLLCFTVARVFDIKYTQLQYVYEELSDTEIQVESYSLCYICYAKLLHCKHLLKNIRGNDCTSQSEVRPLVQLGMLTDTHNYVEIELYPQNKELSTSLAKSGPQNSAISQRTEKKSSNEDAEEALKDKHIPTSKRQTVGKRHTCLVCSKKFSYPSDLKRHELIHTGIKLYACDSCDKKFNYSSHLKAHIQTHSAIKPFTCDVCKKKFSTHTHLKRHKVTHTGARPYSCDVCSKTFTQNNVLKKHKLLHSGRKTDNYNYVEIELYQPTKEKLSASLAKAGPQNLAISQRTEKKSSNEDAKEAVKDRHIPISKRQNVGKRHTCLVCSKTFSYPSDLKRHELIHTGIKLYACDSCDKKFNYVSHLKAHIQTHSTIKSYICNVCKKNFSTRTHLKTHKVIHTGERPYSCDVCFKTFTQTSSLKIHKLTHNGRKSHTCDVCDCAFMRIGDLRIHKVIHADVKPHTCDVCNKQFSRLSHLKQHERTHLHQS